MNNEKINHWNRREFLTNLAVAASTALLGFRSDAFAAEPPPETRRIRIPQIASTCRSPEWIAEELLRAEGFTDVQYVPLRGDPGVEQALASGGRRSAGILRPRSFCGWRPATPSLCWGGSISALRVVGHRAHRSIRDLKGRTVAVPELDPSPYAFLASMVAYVGLDPNKDINWVKHPPDEAMQLLADGKIDAYLGFPPSHKSSALRKSAASWSIARWTGRGRSISAAC